MNAAIIVVVVTIGTAILRLAPILIASRHHGAGRRELPRPTLPASVLVPVSLAAIVASNLAAPSHDIDLTPRLTGLVATILVARRTKSLTIAIAAGLATATGTTAM